MQQYSTLLNVHRVAECNVASIHTIDAPASVSRVPKGRTETKELRAFQSSEAGEVVDDDDDDYYVILHCNGTDTNLKCARRWEMRDKSFR